ncbi:BCL-6 corepressor-like protein 1 isoform X2 [Xenopus laevis]|nr:BCL-6 corepressor-like protein 1 isoform X2 [Xenopus laevis]XP_041431203.1 BCL-6 corepressor-like protein 1 isoform X2 [Xenopus laevis]
MLQEDGAVLEIGQSLEEKPPDPILASGDTVVPKVRDNTLPSDSKQVTNMLDISIQSTPDSKKTEFARAPVPEKPFLCADKDHSVMQKNVLAAGLQSVGQQMEASHTVVSSSFGTLTPFAMSRICFSTTQVPNVQKLPLSFPPGAVLSPTQPLVYIPPSNCGQPLGPTTFGVTSTLTLPMLPPCLQERCLPSIIAPTELHAHAFTSPLGRPLTTDPKVTLTELNKSASTTASISATDRHSVTTAVDGSSICTDPTSTSISTLQTLSSHSSHPMVSVSPVTLAPYSRTLEQQNDSVSSSISPLKSPPQLEREMISPQDSCEMPLDLSSKSHRHKHTPSNQRKTPPMPVLTPVHTSGKASLTTVLSRSDCNTQRPTPNSFTSSSVNQSLRAAPPLVMFPDFLRNGDPGSSQLLGATGSWIKNSAALISTIPGTYVGVANPVPASVLLNKDSNMSLSTDSRHMAKQEPISIIDQGEPKNSGPCGKKANQNSVDGHQSTTKRYPHGHVASVASLCPSKEWTLGHGGIHPKCPLNGKPTNAQVMPVSWSPYHQASLLSIGVSTTGTINANQCATHRLPISEYTLFPSILPADTNVTLQKTGNENHSDTKKINTGATAPEHEQIARGITGDAFSKPIKSIAKKTLAPKPAAGNSVLHLRQTANERTNITDNLKGANNSITLKKVSDKQNGKNEKICPKLTYNRKPFGDTKPKNKVLATYMTPDQTFTQQKDSLSLSLNEQGCSKDTSGADVSCDQQAPAKQSHKRGPKVETLLCVQEVDLSKVKIERVEDDENFGHISTCNNLSWSPVAIPAITKIKTRIKKEPGLRCHSKCLEELTPSKPAQQKSKHKIKRKEEESNKIGQDTPKRKWKIRSAATHAIVEKKDGKKPGKEKTGIRPKRRKRKHIKSEPFDPELDEDITEKRFKNSFRDFIPVVLKSRTRSQTGNSGSDVASSFADTYAGVQEEEHDVPCKSRKWRKIHKACRHGKFTAAKKEPQLEPITPVLQGSWDLSNRVSDAGKSWPLLEEDDEADEDGPFQRRKRRRQKNRKYQNGEYLTEKEEEEVSHCYRRRKVRADLHKRKHSPSDKPIKTCRNKLSTSSRESPKQSNAKNCSHKESPEEFPTSMNTEKPSGKRKFKTKHLGGSIDGEVKGKTKRNSQSPKSSPLKSPSSKKSRDPDTPCRSRRTSTHGSSDTPSTQHIPPETRRLIVNKNAGETLLQRAARLGYKDVVLYCLQRDLGDINHRDNAGYTALHEACARGWTDILQILLDNGANVNCSAQDGTRPIHDAVVNDNLETVWLLLSYGADPTLATYSGQTPMKLASSEIMRKFLSNYLGDLRGHSDGDPNASWDFYSSSVLDGKDEVGYNILLDTSNISEEEPGEDKDLKDNFLFEFSDKPLLYCHNLHVSLSSGPSNWLLFSDVLKRLKLSSRIFQARYPNFEVASMQKKEFTKQVLTSQLLTPTESLDLWPQDMGDIVELVKYEPELLQLLGSSIEFQGVSS